MISETNVQKSGGFFLLQEMVDPQIFFNFKAIGGTSVIQNRLCAMAIL